MNTNNYTDEERLTIASTIWRQLGSQRFSLMTGCRPLVYGEEDGKVYLLMSVGSNSRMINRFEVVYDGTDVYNVRFMMKSGDKTDVVAGYSGVYQDRLHTLFERHTGLDLRFS